MTDQCWLFESPPPPCTHDTLQLGTSTFLLQSHHPVQPRGSSSCQRGQGSSGAWKEGNRTFGGRALLTWRGVSGCHGFRAWSPRLSCPGWSSKSEAPSPVLYTRLWQLLSPFSLSTHRLLETHPFTRRHLTTGAQPVPCSVHKAFLGRRSQGRARRRRLEQQQQSCAVARESCGCRAGGARRRPFAGEVCWLLSDAFHSRVF